MILIAPTAFKGTLTAAEAARAMADGARAALRATGAGGARDTTSRDGRAIEVRVAPLSDGGNGLLDALAAADGGKASGVRVAGPLGASVTARYLVQEARVVVESAEACGLHLVPTPLRDPMRTTTRGVGELLLAAAQAGCEEVGGQAGAPVSRRALVVGLGGSATVDAGAGMASALGWRLLDEEGAPIPAGGRGLMRLHAIEAPVRPPAWPTPMVLADVTNPLLGREGAAAVYAPQKGASPADVAVLERALAHWARVVERDLDRDVAGLPGAGAAGGLGAAFAAFLDAPPRRGADWLLDAVGFDGLLGGARVVVTGEGAWDAQSSMGKVTGEVVRRARAAGVPVLMVTGAAEAPPGAGVTVVAGGPGLGTNDLAALVRDAIPGLLRDAGTP